ncbi:MAG TPA: hypothetical protein VNE62_03210 [Actinomycetota bacterium]|nr:hypothetical protein [Actinomycetota bacterium]
MRLTAALTMALVLAISACLSQGTASTISKHCSQDSVKEAPADLETAIDEFVQSIPAADTFRYADPKRDPEDVKALVEGFAKVAGGDLVAACQALAPVAYRVVLTTDSKTGRDVVLLRESRGGGGFARAWGLYVVSWPPMANPSTLTVEVPHACPHTVPRGCEGGDRLTHLVAVKVFREANARYLFINGADRRANGMFGLSECEQDSRCSDVAHQPESPFEKIHEKAVADLGSNTKVYQSHRFLSSNHDPPPMDNVSPGTSGTANVVVSAGTTSPSPIAGDVAGGIEAAERSFFHVCLFSGGPDCSQLGATRNVQKDHMFGGRFVHVEANDTVVRESCEAPCRRDELAAAIAGVMK